MGEDRGREGRGLGWGGHRGKEMGEEKKVGSERDYNTNRYE